MAMSKLTLLFGVDQQIKLTLTFDNIFIEIGKQN